MLPGFSGICFLQVKPGQVFLPHSHWMPSKVQHLLLSSSFTGQGVKEPWQKTHCKNAGTCASCFPVKPLLEQQERLPKCDSHTGIMQVLEVSFQYYHICKYLSGSSFQALNVFTKQEALTNKDQPPAFGLICLNPPPTGVRDSPALPGSWIQCRGSCKTQNPRIC